ncbi:DUF6678 family protein [Metabacillus niabensis]|uniref:DUF6678 family protein n=1 Tax=Metabacillus niabensis TaxID=324854 RepID=UPI0039A2304F
MESLKKKVQAIIIEKQLCSIMNNTKWEKLQSGVLNRLPFTPPYQIKYILQEKPEPVTFDNDVWYLGDWIEGLFPFYAIEWIKVRPRYVKHKGRLVDDEVIDITEQFRELLHNLHIPYKEENNAFYIYGYAASTELIRND